MRSILIAAVFALLALPAAAHDYKVGDVFVGHIWAAETTPKAKNGVAYVPLRNDGKEEDTLLSADTDAAEKVEFHETVISNGVASMRPLPPVVIKPGKTVDFKPGGKHMMLVGLKKPITDGEKFDMVLHFAKAGDITVSVHVQKKAPGVMEDHSAHEHNHGDGTAPHSH